MRNTTPDRKITPFNKEHIYKTQIECLVDELVKLCTIHNLPMFFSCCVKNDENSSTYIRQCVPADAHGVNLTDDEIQKHVCLQLGFDTIYRHDEELEFEEEGTKITE